MQTVIIEQWAILRHGMEVVVRRAHPASTVTEVGTAAEGLAACSRRTPTLVIVGQAPDSSVEKMVATLGRHSPQAKLIALIDATHAAGVRSVLAAGASAVLSRSADADELVDAMARVFRNERVLSSDLVGVLADVAAVSDVDTGSSANVVGLTPREAEILHRLARGASNREIAVALYIGEATVKTHLGKVYDKLGVSNRHQAVSRAFELGILASSSPRVQLA